MDIVLDSKFSGIFDLLCGAFFSLVLLRFRGKRVLAKIRLVRQFHTDYTESELPKCGNKYVEIHGCSRRVSDGFVVCNCATNCIFRAEITRREKGVFFAFCFAVGYYGGILADVFHRIRAV